MAHEEPDLGQTTLEDSLETNIGSGRPEGFQLVIVWHYGDPGRAGEVFDVPRGRPGVIGRDPSALRPVRRRPGGDVVRPGFDDPHISRRHLLVQANGQQGVTVRRGGRSAVLVRDQRLEPEESRQAIPGTLIQLGKRLLLLVTFREQPEGPPGPLHEFGEPDGHGIVGETAASWRLRDTISKVGPSRSHALVRGESGVGKELVARAIHETSERSGRPLVDRNAATFTEGLMDAELVGNLKGYPNPGMVERSGLIGASDGTTLFLDEIGDLPLSLQPKLLRVMDNGEYQRLGEARTRTSDVRVVGATNQPREMLRHDLAARFTVYIDIPPLRERVADVPLIVRHMARTLHQDNPHLAEGLLDEDGEPRIRCRWMRWLVLQRLSANVREVYQEFMRALQARCPGEPIDLPRPSAESELPTPVEAGGGAFRDPDTISCEEVVQAMASGRPVREVAEMLGLKNRDQLYRLRRRCGLL
ncbi:MAG: sigma 54-interacting transcriptional regulator [Myxococcota bacterium]